jgi:spore coat protein U-like protein
VFRCHKKKEDRDMRRILHGSVATLFFASIAPLAFSGTVNNNLTVTATVISSCSISNSPVAFGNYDGIVTNATTALTGNGSLTVTCTTGSPANIQMSQGANPATGSTAAVPLRRLANGTNYLSYSLFQNSALTTVWGNTTGTGATYTGTGTSSTITVYGSVASGQNEPVGSYSDTVVASITF